MKFSPPAWLLGSLLVPVLLGVIFIGSRVGNALDVGNHEGMVLSRALLWNRQPAAVLRMQSNPPGLYTRLLATEFNLFGPCAASARLFSLVSVAAMMVALGWLLRQTVGAWGSLLTGIFLFSIQGILSLAMAALPGLPAVAWALVSVALGYKPSCPPHWIRILLSGAVWACAINLDASAWMLWPAFLALTFREWRPKSAVISLGFWTIGLTAASLLIALGAPISDWTRVLGVLPQAKLQPVFHWNAPLSNPALLLATGCGIWQMLRNKASAPLLFASIWLATDLLLAGTRLAWLQPGVAQVYVPLAILGAAGFASVFSGAVTVFRPSPSQSANHGFQALGAITIFAFWVGFGVPTFVSGLGQLNHLPNTRHDGLCLSIRKYATVTHWCYTRFPEYAFGGGVMIPPELVTLPLPQPLELNPAGEWTLKLAQQQQPEQLLLAKNVELQNPAWAEWATNHYVLVYQDGQKELWVSRRLHPAPIPPPNALLRKMGL